MAHAPAKRPSSLICETDPRSPAAEAYRTLRTNLQFSALSTKGPHVLLVASASPREGKTTTVGNLGVVLAQEHATVLGDEPDDAHGCRISEAVSFQLSAVSQMKQRASCSPPAVS